MTVLFLVSCVLVSTNTAAQPLDEAKQAGWNAEYFYPKKIHNYFKGMDVISVPREGNPSDAWPDPLLEMRPRAARKLVDSVSTESEILGRNTWMLWCTFCSYCDPRK